MLARVCLYLVLVVPRAFATCTTPESTPNPCDTAGANCITLTGEVVDSNNLPLGTTGANGAGLTSLNQLTTGCYWSVTPCTACKRQASERARERADKPALCPRSQPVYYDGGTDSRTADYDVILVTRCSSAVLSDLFDEDGSFFWDGAAIRGTGYFLTEEAARYSFHYVACPTGPADLAEPAAQLSFVSWYTPAPGLETPLPAGVVSGDGLCPGYALDGGANNNTAPVVSALANRTVGVTDQPECATTTTESVCTRPKVIYNVNTVCSQDGSVYW